MGGRRTVDDVLSLLLLGFELLEHVARDGRLERRQLRLHLKVRVVLRPRHRALRTQRHTNKSHIVRECDKRCVRETRAKHTVGVERLQTLQKQTAVRGDYTQERWKSETWRRRVRVLGSCVSPESSRNWVRQACFLRRISGDVSGCGSPGSDGRWRCAARCAHLVTVRVEVGRGQRLVAVITALLTVGVPCHRHVTVMDTKSLCRMFVCRMQVFVGWRRAFLVRTTFLILLVNSDYFQRKGWRGKGRERFAGKFLS